MECTKCVNGISKKPKYGTLLKHNDVCHSKFVFWQPFLFGELGLEGQGLKV